jgi:hypothetical protein
VGDCRLNKVLHAKDPLAGVVGEESLLFTAIAGGE